ncbi:MAG: winged helix-turn-helix domain-containing protein [Casimicrobiaceae bacterium]
MPVIYRFGRFELRPATRQLLVDEQPAALGTRAFDLLLALIERRERMVTKSELFDLVWSGLVVEEGNLQVQVSTLRKVLGADAIATIAGHGYRFMLEATQVEAPSQSAATAARHNLPAQVASFIGRERELVDLRAVLEHHRLVTLTGVGGIGKTRLALELASLVVDAYPEGAWFVDLAPLSDPTLVPDAVAAALGVREQAGRPVLEALRRFVSDRRFVLLLDNCEHLLPACAQLARDLLEASHRMTIVATSREPLHVSGEAAFPLATLPAPDPRGEFSVDALSEYAAVRLFFDRAIAARPDFTLTRQNAAAVANICRDLDGIPLALELAAARVRAMSAEAIAGHLTDRFRLLKSGDVTVLPRQQTLRATIDWSYDLLAPPERALFLRLSVFAGSFALDAAEAVGTGNAMASRDVLDVLSRLVDKSLVAFDAENDRYRLLETVRQYALERLAEPGDEARDRHLEFYVALAQRAGQGMYGARQTHWRNRLDAERENILLAFEHARRAPGGGPAALRMIHGLGQWLGWNHLELWHRVELEALAHPDAQEENLDRVRALYIAAQAAYLTGRYDESFTLVQDSVRIARACGDPAELAEALYRLGIVAMAVDRSADAHGHLAEGLALARQVGDRALLASLSGGMGEFYSQQGQLELADQHYLEFLDGSRDDVENTMVALTNLARNAIALRAEAKAVRYLRETVAAGTPCSAMMIQAFLRNFAGLAALREEWAFALRLSGSADAHRKQHGPWGEFVDERFYALSIAPARARLGNQAAEAALAMGHALSCDVALREAESWLDSLPDSPVRELLEADSGESHPGKPLLPL